MSRKTFFIWVVVAAAIIAVFAGEPAELGAGDAFVLIFLTASALFGAILNALIRGFGSAGFCKLGLPPGPSAAGKLRRVA
jgi:hypothetical protein